MGGKGRRKGSGKGKGKSRAKGASKGARRRPVARVARPVRPRATGAAWGSNRSGAALPEDPLAPFLHPSSRPLIQVPLEFSSLRHWCEVIGNNILAEFWHMFKEARASFTGYGTAAGDELMLENAPAEGFSQCLLLLDRQPRIAASQRVLGVGRVAVKLRGGAVRSGQVKSLGYVGSFLSEFSAALELRNLHPKDMTPPMRAILEPKVDLQGDYAYRRINSALVPVNPSQRAAIEGLKFALEKIQGPPGTGKSTTIFHILDAKVPTGSRVLVTCSRNVAVESIAQKLSGLEDWPLCVFGPRDRVGESARRYLLDSQVGGYLDERRRSKVAALVQDRGKLLRLAIEGAEARCRGCRGERFLLSFLRSRFAAACVEKAQRNTLKVSSYFGAYAPRWFLGMGWVFGRRIVDFLARNVADLKKHGAADVQLGFWLAPLEGIHWVDMKEGQFHDYPMPGSTFSKGCTDKTILVHRMNEDRWKDFDAKTCELHCPLTAVT